MKTVAVILSGGSGQRIGGDLPKQYRETCGRTMISRAMAPFFIHPAVEEVRIVADVPWHEKVLADIAGIAKTKDMQNKMTGFSAPGDNRALSILHALRDLENTTEDNDIVILHDAARPFVSETLITRLIDTCASHDGALPVLPMKDTVYLTMNAYRTQDERAQGRIASLLQRDHVVAGQAPEAFRFGAYLRALEALLPERIMEISGSTEVALLAGLDVALIDGEESNYKITTAADMRRYEKECKENKSLGTA